MNLHENNAYSSNPVAVGSMVNAFLRGVYGWMGAGLGITAVVAFICTYTSFAFTLFSENARFIFYGAIIAELAMVFFLSAKIQTLSGGVAAGLFFGYSALNGLTLSFILVQFTQSSVMAAFITTAGMFAAMSVYGLITKKDLSSWGSLLFMGLIGLIIAMVVNLFLGSSMLEFLICLAGVAIFLGLTAYDTQLLKEMGESVPHDDPTAVHRASIMGALRLYLDFINIFIMLLQLIGDRR